MAPFYWVPLYASTASKLTIESLEFTQVSEYRMLPGVSTARRAVTG